jgi:hypothetical protein
MKILFLSFFISLTSTICCFAQNPVIENCTFKGKPLWGRVRVVDNAEDIKVKIVDNAEDVRVRIVENAPFRCGQWQFVENAEVIKIRFVDNAEDIKIRFVDNDEGATR